MLQAIGNIHIGVCRSVIEDSLLSPRPSIRYICSLSTKTILCSGMIARVVVAALQGKQVLAATVVAGGCQPKTESSSEIVTGERPHVGFLS